MKIYQDHHIEKIKFTSRKFKILTHPEKLSIIELIIENPGINVTQIHTKLEMRQTDASGHLAMLKRYGIVDKKRKGQNVIYSVNEKEIEKISKFAGEIYKAQYPWVLS